MVERCFAALPRIVLFALILLIGAAALLTVFAPIAFVCSYQSSPGICTWVSSGYSKWHMDALGWNSRNVLCALAFKACSNGMMLTDTLSAFQALFGFAIVLDLVTYYWDKCRKALETLETNLKKLLESTSALLPVEAAEYQKILNQRRSHWVPLYAGSIRVTVQLVHLSFLLTAIISGAVLVLPFVTNNQRLPFLVPQTILFALSPFVAIILLQTDRIIAESLITRSIAPHIYWKRFQANQHERRLLMTVRIYTFGRPPIALVGRRVAWLGQQLIRGWTHLRDTVMLFFSPPPPPSPPPSQTP